MPSKSHSHCSVRRVQGRATVGLLLRSGANPNLGSSIFDPVDGQEFTPLRFAAHEGHTELIRLLLAGGPGGQVSRLDQQPLVHAACFAHQYAVEALLLGGFPINGQGSIMAGVGGRLTHASPLFAAAFSGHIRMVTYLLQRGAHVTPRILISAVDAGQGPCVEAMLLLDASNINSLFADFAPLHVAAMHGDREMIGLLHRLGADLKRLTPQGLTPLQVARGSERGAAAVGLLMALGG